MAILELKDIRSLNNRYEKVVNFINEINNDFPSGQKVKQVQIPSSMTQSLAYHFILQNPKYFGMVEARTEFLREGTTKTYDLIYEHNEKKLNIEVKATGTNVFQRFRPHALTADIIIWLNFDNSHYDIAIFRPELLTNLISPENGEVNINWQNLTKIEGIVFIKSFEI